MSGELSIGLNNILLGLLHMTKNHKVMRWNILHIQIKYFSCISHYLQQNRILIFVLYQIWNIVVHLLLG